MQCGTATKCPYRLKFNWVVKVIELKTTILMWDISSNTHTHTHTPPSSVHCSHRCVVSPRCWSQWRPQHWRYCTQELQDSGGSSGCSLWWPHSHTWGCTWSPSPVTGDSLLVCRVTHNQRNQSQHGGRRINKEIHRPGSLKSKLSCGE